MSGVVRLWRLAQAVERQHGARLLRVVTSAGASAMLILAAVFLTFATSVSEEREVRGEALRPVRAGASEPALFVDGGSFVSVANQQVTKVVVVPASGDAPLPPGVREWPAPGEVVVSPRLLRLVVEDGNRGQFGDVAGIISDDGLVEPSELRMYVRPLGSVVDLSELTPAAGWSGDGGRVPSQAVSLLNASQLPSVYLMVLSSLGFGALLSLFLARRVGGRQQVETETNLRLAGASGPQLAVLRVMAAVRSLVGGAAVAGCVLVVLCTVQVSLPFVSFISDPAAYRAQPASAALAFTAGVVLSVWLTSLPVRTGRRRMQGRTSVREEQPTPWALAVVVGAGLAVLGPVWAGSPLGRVVSYLGGVALVMVGLPAVAARLMAIVGRAVAEVSTRAGSAGGIIAGRYLQRRPRSVARVAAPACLALLFVGQAHLWAGQFSAQYLDGVRVQDRLGGSTLTTGATASADDLVRFIGELPDGVGHVWVSATPPTDAGNVGETRVGGSCANLRVLGLPCPRAERVPLGEVRLQRTSDVISTVAVPESVVIERLDNPPASDSTLTSRLLVFSADGDELPHGELQRLGFATVQGGLDLNEPGASWVGGGHVNYVRAGWVALHGLVATAMLLFVSAGVLAAEARSRAERLAGVAATFGTTRWRVAYASVDVGLPTALAAALGAASYLVLPLGLQYQVGTIRPSMPLAVATLGVSFIVAAVLAALTAHAIRTAARDWRPGSVV